MYEGCSDTKFGCVLSRHLLQNQKLKFDPITNPNNIILL